MFRPLRPLLLTALLLACGGDDDDGSANGTDGDGALSSPAAEASPRPTAADDKPTEEAAPAAVSDEPVRFETSDGVTIAGHLYSGGGPKRKAAVLAHEFPRDQTAWTAFAKTLAAAGIDALTIDFRGYGETGGERDVSKIDLDVEYAARFIASRDYEQVYLIGASMGGTAAIKVASRLDLAGVVTLSSPPEIMGLDATLDIAAVDEPALFIAGQGDAGGAYASTANSFVAASSPASAATKEALVVSEWAHGTDLLGTESGDEIEQRILGFLEAN